MSTCAGSSHGGSCSNSGGIGRFVRSASGAAREARPCASDVRGQLPLRQELTALASASGAGSRRGPTADAGDARRGLATAAAVVAALAGSAALTATGSVACDVPAPCLAELEEGSDSSVVKFNVEKDRPGLLADAKNVLKKAGLDILDAKISADSEDRKATHVYHVVEKTTGRGLSLEKLEELREALDQLGEVSASMKSWPIYTRAEVAQHTTIENRVWVSYKQGVYDITDFIVNHPGGKDKIMLAAGKPIDPFWRIYQQHEGRGTAVAQLERMRIGSLADPLPLVDPSDPYRSDPDDRHPGLIFHNRKPCNAEVPLELLGDSWITPSAVWFIRHHHPVPTVDPKKFSLKVEGANDKEFTLTLEDIRSRFTKREITATIQCGGNRRAELDKVEKTSGIPWAGGAISNAKWGGVSLREVLTHCGGVSLEGAERGGFKHVVFYGLDDMQVSIPIEKALNPFGDVLLAYEMNGEVLPREHGYPLRLIVPGVVGVRNVKWVSRIKLSAEEAEGPWQRGIAYKGFSPMQKDLANVDVDKVMTMQEMPVNSVIMYPKEGAVTELDDIEVRGWAWSGGGRGIVRVDVSVDDGKTWVTAELGEGRDQNPWRSWAWTFWQASVPIPPALHGKVVTLMCRATDASYSTQPKSAAPLWNLRGLSCNCWHQVQVKHVAE